MMMTSLSRRGKTIGIIQTGHTQTAGARMTPEGRVKAKINRLLSKYKSVYKFMPVPSGYGLSSLDYLLCVGGQFVGVEAKAPGKSPTPRQGKIMDQIERAGGIVMLVDGDATLADLKAVLDVCMRRT